MERFILPDIKLIDRGWIDNLDSRKNVLIPYRTVKFCKTEQCIRTMTALKTTRNYCKKVLENAKISCGLSIQPEVDFKTWFPRLLLSLKHYIELKQNVSGYYYYK